jgi:TolB-like protein
MTPDGIKREHEVDRTTSITPTTGKKLDRAIIAVMALGLIYFAYDKFVAGPTEPASPATVVSQELPAEDEQKSIAVLPLANRSAREEDQFFTDGIHDDLLTQLAKISSLTVISRTSVMRYRDTELPIPEIAKQLGVKTILEGGIQRSGNQVRINMQLIEAETDKHLWAETYDRELTAENLFVIQSEITKAITEALKATLTPEEVARLDDQPTENLEAYQEYMRGQQLLALRTVDGIEEGKVHFERAVELDPGFGQAVVGLANAYHLMNEYVGLPDEESLVPAMELVSKAIESAPELGEAYMVRGELYRHSDEYDLSQADFERAMELLPGNATVLHWYSFLKNEQGLEDEGFELLQRAHQLNPMSRVIHLNIAIQPFFEGRDEETLIELGRLKQLHPDYPQPYSYESWISRMHGDPVGALRGNLKLLELDPRNTRSGFHCFNYFSLNAMESTRECITGYDGPRSRRRVFMEVMLLLIDNDQESALALLEAATDAEGDGDWIAYAYLAAREYDAARPEYEQDHADWFEFDKPVAIHQGDIDHAIDAALIMMHAGEQERATQLLTVAIEAMEGFKRNRGASAIGFSDVQALAVLGQTDKALDALEEAVEMEYLSDWQALKFLPHYDSIRDDPRFASAIRNLSAVADLARKRAVDEGLL